MKSHISSVSHASDSTVYRGSTVADKRKPLRNMTGVMSPDQGAMLGLEGFDVEFHCECSDIFNPSKMFLFQYLPRKANDSKGKRGHTIEKCLLVVV